MMKEAAGFSIVLMKDEAGSSEVVAERAGS
jgi:hypothetical protein